ncbi:MAG: energy transducer TonB [Pyrinomonadaceae bacterium]|nr:energy transducer TonB [Pyrinomonadaceae bacterium]
MPLNVRRLGAFVGLVLIFVFGTFAQAPTSVDVMRSRISKAKALVAVKNYAAAIYELEGIKRETNDPAVNSVVQVMLMNCYLESLDYKRAQALLTEVFNSQKNNKPGSNYFVVAGQVVKGARNQVERYKSLGLSVSDRNLPTEAIADVEKMRETVESVVEHSKTLGDNKKLQADSMALLEEATSARSGLARDDYDAKRWKEELADARDRMTNSRTTVINTVQDGLPSTIDANKTLATTNAPIITMSPEQNQARIIPVSSPSPSTISKTDNQPTSGNPIIEKKDDTAKVSQQTVAKNEPVENKVIDISKENKPAEQPKIEKVQDTPKVESNDQSAKTKEENFARERTVGKQDNSLKNETVSQNNTPVTEQLSISNETAKSNDPLQVGSLIDYATARVSPTYPPAAKSMRMTGTVKVEVLVNEDGSIGEVKNTSGPSMLQRAAVDALKKWKFKPFTKDGQAVKASGFVSFNFNL